MFANEAFYLAFGGRDYDVMASLWASDHRVLCVHPGWRLLEGRAAVLGSWRRILDNVQQPGIDFFNAEATVLPGTVLVTCYEKIGDGVCLCTNAFVLEGDAPKMVLHHSGMCAEPPDELLS